MQGLGVFLQGNGIHGSPLCKSVTVKLLVYFIPVQVPCPGLSENQRVYPLVLRTSVYLNHHTIEHCFET